TGLERLVDLDKQADYVGKDALLRIAKEGVRRKLVGVELGNDQLSYELAEAWPVRGSDGPIGRVTDAIWSPRLQKNIGYAWVPIELGAPGTELTVDSPQGSTTARVVTLPFLDPSKKIPAASAELAARAGPPSPPSAGRSRSGAAAG